MRPRPGDESERDLSACHVALLILPCQLSSSTLQLLFVLFPYIFYHSTHVPLLLKARLCFRSRVQTYATSSVVHKGKISRSRLLFFSPHYLTAL